MRSEKIEITTANSSRALLTLPELRSVLGPDGKDADVLAVGLRVAAKITAACKIAEGSGSSEPTLLRETVTETFYDVCAVEELILARRHEVMIESVTIDGTAIADLDDDVVVNSEAGLIKRRIGGKPSCWTGTEIVIVYAAGFEAIPQVLKAAALEQLQWEKSRAARDPYVKSETTDIPGVINKSADYWVGAVPGQDDGEPVSSSVLAQLRRFMNG